ncbi:hypothetical protein WN48_01391 [Eufriesea mexicana]|uniref:Uncharacterized protein n=1 Tax=Eufriesea mexicana TaxID=516756 RepID=A0A310SPM1_9HYME|nr:PREDICTED: uncharacterized protein LOC108547858 [Eufriesea mexicana]OAD57854.1 hypothetical protein WN48_01391 [Eufriesea mexicana]
MEDSGIRKLIQISKWHDSELAVLQVNDVSRSYPQCSTIDDRNARINRIVYGLLKEKQRYVFDKIHSVLGNPAIYPALELTTIGGFLQTIGQRLRTTSRDIGTMAMLLDAPSGTGKTWLLMSLLITMHRNDVVFLVYQRNLRLIAESIRGIRAYTCMKYLMELLCMEFSEAKNYFVEDIACLSIFQKIIRTKIKYSCKLIILDEYTVVSPWYVLWVYWIAKQNGACVLYCGDRYALNSMNRSRFHNESNYTIVEALSGPKFFDMDQLRIQDENYENKVNQFKVILERSNDDLDMTLEIKNELYRIFEDYFSVNTDMTATYLAEKHEDLYRRAYDICEYYENNSTGCYKSPYYSEDEYDDDMREISIELLKQHNLREQFLEFLPLIEGYTYYYITPEGNRCLVKYIGRSGKEILVEDVENGLSMNLGLEKITSDYCVSEEFNWLKDNCEGVPYQYPLRLRLRTYHSLQGHTTEDKNKVELNIDVKRSNCVYVGLSHIRRESQLGRLHTNDLFNIRSHCNSELCTPVEEPSQPKSLLVKLAMYLRNVSCSRLEELVEEPAETERLRNDINDYLSNVGETPLDIEDVA